jgi:hypothetical protein
VRIVLEIPIDEDGPRAVKDLLDALAVIWARRLRRVPLPPLYSSGIYYAEEENIGKFEDWQSPSRTFELGKGDCDDLVLYRVAELQAAGERATVQCLAQRSAIGVKMHVRVRRANGVEEDPSVILTRR